MLYPRLHSVAFLERPSLGLGTERGFSSLLYQMWRFNNPPQPGGLDCSHELMERRMGLEQFVAEKPCIIRQTRGDLCQVKQCANSLHRL